MEITIKSESFFNADPPELTEEMLDWLFHTMYSTRFENLYKEVRTMDIVANTPFNGSSHINFYITINGDKENTFHREFILGVNLDKQSTPLGHTDSDGCYIPMKNILDEPIERWEWVGYFVNCGVDMGPEGEEYERRSKEMWAEYERREEKRQKEEGKNRRYQLYLEYKKEFEPSHWDLFKKILPWLPLFGGIVSQFNAQNYFKNTKIQIINFVYHVLILLIIAFIIYKLVN